MNYVNRTLEPLLKRAVEAFPAVVLTGPRQSGKTTLLRHLFGEKFGYVNLDVGDVRRAAEEDPREFLAQNKPPVIFDEAQAVPSLFSYLRARIDENRDERGQYILTGSQNFQLLQSISESLAGRAAILHLFPMTQRELALAPELELPWEREKLPVETMEKEIWHRFQQGYYPEIALGRAKESKLWLESYIETYLERDIRSLSELGDLARFKDFLRVVAARSGSLMNYSEMSNAMGVSINTIKSWISLLQASYQVMILRPWHTNIKKQMTKTPKLYMTDTGLMCSLLGVHDAEQLRRSDIAGAVVETAVVNEVRKSIAHLGRKSALHFWRTAAGTEVDLLVERGDERIALEVKKSSTPQKKHSSSLRQLKKDLPDVVRRGYVIHLGEMILPQGDEIIALPYTML